MAMKGEGVDSVEPQFVDSITQAIQGLREGTDNLNASMPPADLAGMFSGLQMGDVSFVNAVFAAKNFKKRNFQMSRTAATTIHFYRSSKV